MDTELRRNRVRRSVRDLVVALSEQTGESLDSMVEEMIAVDLRANQGLGRCQEEHGDLHYHRATCMGFRPATSNEIAEDTFARIERSNAER